ncbi:glycosyltransferase family 31 protein [Pochonia chlamydosporia 170]|uniref:Glycosyltransferase family 31 protein n=1 Tax=Pochonia chlamydosporia 170 TaxID=1380566 RepID=A0A179F160_METCM|nr:glycosyltransferase family 31 protein [Pochonia chlamydosporia 170]OAQ58879.1 glycosyltransferase family 31 protein [Pochonia chlamydosporia 170]
MGVVLTGPKRSMTMRSPFGRALLAALCVLLVLMAMLKTESIPVRPQLFGKPGVKANAVHEQKPLDDSNSPVTSSSMIGNGNVISSNFNINCSVDIPHLQKIRQKYNLDERFQYMKRYVRFTRTEGLERKRMTKISHNLLNGAFKTVDMNKQYGQDACENPLEVQVPASGLPSAVNASDFMFGVSTTFKRFMDSETTPINEWIYWLTDSRGHSNGGKLVLMLLDASDDELQEVANLLGDVGIDVDVYHSDSSLEMAVRYLSLVPTLYTHPDAKKKKWLVTCDDDTFFPSMHELIDKMGKYDHTREMYIGTLSEDTGAIERHGSQAFGGGGVFLSVPLAEKLTELFGSCTTEQKVLESNSGWGPQGDIILRKCIYENTDTRLTTFWDLWQLDIFGHPAGFYEWGIKPLSLHHYRGGGWHKAKPGMYTKIAHTCGEDCTLMRFQTKDDFIISGYSIAHYPDGVTFDTNQLEATLHAAPEDKGWNLDFMMGPRRPNLEKTGKKISWELEESEVQSDGSVLQTYTRKQNDDRWVHPDKQPMSNIDGVIELVWIPS